MNTQMLSAMTRVWGKSYFPDAPENINDSDFQAGYAIGLLNEGKSIAASDHAITVEWKRRGFQGTEQDEAFKAWRRGYWAGRYIAITNPETHEDTQ